VKDPAETALGFGAFAFGVMGPTTAAVVASRLVLMGKAGEWDIDDLIPEIQSKDSGLRVIVLLDWGVFAPVFNAVARPRIERV